jgi:hypothetical protein
VPHGVPHNGSFMVAWVMHLENGCLVSFQVMSSTNQSAEQVLNQVDIS